MPNQSFVDISELLKYMNVKNNDFMLKLNNEELKDIDPHSEDLTDEQKSAIIEECKNNIWYFIRELVLVPDKRFIDTYIPYQLDMYSLANIWCSYNNISNYVVTTKEDDIVDIAPVIVWKLLYDESADFEINNPYDGGHELYNHVKDIIKHLPNYIIQEIITITEDGISIGKRSCELNSYVISKKNVEAIRRWNYDKISIYPNFEYMPLNVELLHKHKPRNAFDIMVSLQNDDNTPAYKNILDLISKSCPWENFLYDLDVNMVKRYINQNSRTNIVYIGYTYIGPKETSEQYESYMVGPPGSDGIHIGPEPPTDPNKYIWIDLSDEIN